MGLTITPHHATYYAHDLTRRAASGMDRLSMALFDAAVDLNPHQIEASLFALQSPLSKGVVLADEVGLGKTIEAGIVLCQFWAERKRRLLVICPASIRKQWALELEEKFNLPVQVVDTKAYPHAGRGGQTPLGSHAVVVMSHHFANRLREELKTIAWDLVVIDEAHKLRNAYRPSNKVGQGIRWATEDCRKLLLTATPLQNSLLELYGLSTLIDERLFGDVNSFRSQYASAGSNLEALRQRLSIFCKRTLRNEVMEYIRYTERRPITRPFKPTDQEHSLYESVSDFLQREDSYALPQRQRHLTALILRKLLASSSQAIAATLDTLRARLETLRDEQASNDPDFTVQLISADEIEDDLLDEILVESEDADQPGAPQVTIDRQKLREEIGVLQRLATRARAIGIDTKTRALLKALEIGFEQMATTGAARKALIFTESRRTHGMKAIWFDKHLYRPLLYLESKIVEISPAPLNKGERQFVEDLKAFHDGDEQFFRDHELYLLRNLSRGRGVGFFEAGNFHPDFILWLLAEGQQTVLFVDPKGIRNIGPSDPKIQFFETIKEVEHRLGDPTVRLESFIVSNTSSATMRMQWDMEKSEIQKRHIVFQEEDRDSYVRAILKLNVS